VIDEVLGIVGSVDDFILKFVRQGVIVETSDPKGFTDAVKKTGKRGETVEFPNPNADRESVTARGAPIGTRVHRLIENLGLAESDPHVQRLIANIEKNLPELSIEEKIAGLSQLTGPAAERIVAPMQRRVDDSAGNYYGGIRKLGQMCVSIMGELVNSGRFGLVSQLSPAQQKFRPFRLASYDRGELDFSLRTPRLLKRTMTELAAEAASVEKLQTPWGMEHAGLSRDEIYGPNATPNDVGLLTQKEESRANASQGFAQIFNGGGSI
jgi:hypothetical protein